MTERRYHEKHMWVRESAGEVTVGITNYAQDEMGDIIYVELPEVGATVAAGEPFVTVESAKAVQDLLAPLSGEVIRANEELSDIPELVNENPYEAGWLIVVTPEDFHPGELMDEEEYEQFLESQ